jgi:hypothetical protein
MSVDRFFGAWGRRWDRPWCRCRSRPGVLCARFRTRRVSEPLLPSLLPLLPQLLLSARPRLLSTGGVLSAPAQLLEPLLRLLLRLLTTRAPAVTAPHSPRWARRGPDLGS